MTFNFTLLLVGVLQIFGYFVEGCAGFGASVIASPINASLLGPITSIPFATVLALPMLCYNTVRSIKEKSISYKDLGKILLAIVPGFLLGNYLGTIMDAEIAKLGIGSAVTLIALINIYRHIIKPLVFKIPVEEETEMTTAQKVFAFTCLIIGGIVHGAFTIGGPLITVYTLNVVKDKYKFRNTMLAFFFILDTFNAGRHALTGMWTVEVWNAVLIALPFTFIGYFLGRKFLDKVNRAQFLRFVYIVLLCTGGNMFIRSLITLF